MISEPQLTVYIQYLEPLSTNCSSIKIYDELFQAPFSQILFTWVIHDQSFDVRPNNPTVPNINEHRVEGVNHLPCKDKNNGVSCVTPVARLAR